MIAELAYQPAVWFLAVLALAACWPAAQAQRHAEMKPLAAWLLFTSMLAIVGGLSFSALALIAAALFGGDALGSGGPAFVILLLALAPGVMAGRAAVRRPQRRRMPR